MWRIFRPDAENPWCDIIPENDEKLHITSSFEEAQQCPCCPAVEWADEEGGVYDFPVVIHSAFDGREIIEQAEEILKR